MRDYFCVVLELADRFFPKGTVYVNPGVVHLKPTEQRVEQTVMTLSYLLKWKN